ncbi:hypothetical protein K438DRAFT_1795816 [Mycena galopus ATCC 62051]|nr:hypothetical protein K438DRAFT_1795816 [Mycena galopus ATCC 62051]
MMVRSPPAVREPHPPPEISHPKRPKKFKAHSFPGVLLSSSCGTLLMCSFQIMRWTSMLFYWSKSPQDYCQEGQVPDLRYVWMLLPFDGRLLRVCRCPEHAAPAP